MWRAASVRWMRMDIRRISTRTRIEKHGDQAEYTEDDGATSSSWGEDTLVSMNLWGFTSSILKELKARFVPFWRKTCR